MKIKYIGQLIIIVMLFNLSYAFSSGPSQTKTCGENCTNHKFAYRFCKVSSGVSAENEFICSNSPHNESDLILIHQSIPINFLYEAASLKSVLDHVGNTVGFLTMHNFDTGKEDDIFTGAHEYIEEYISEASKQWTKLCEPSNGIGFFVYDNPDNSIYACQVKVYWSQDKSDFVFPGYPDDYYSLMVTRTTTKDNNFKINCSKSHIRMNDCKEFLKKDPSNSLIPIARRFFYMRNPNIHPLGFNTYEVPNKYKDKNDKKYYMEYYDFYGCLMHEIGHWFGFGHKSNHLLCGVYDGIMVDKIEALTNYDLTDDDKCMFKKVYCCSESFLSVEEFISDYFLKFEVYPNPTTKSLSVSFVSKLITNISFEIVDVEGKVLSTFIKNSSSENQFQIDVSSLQSGTYFIKTKINNNYMGYKFIKN